MSRKERRERQLYNDMVELSRSGESEVVTYWKNGYGSGYRVTSVDYEPNGDVTYNSTYRTATSTPRRVASRNDWR
ncbi:hypothetical protein CpipJ_CPIJ019944 [Culex quinquefasciatus]|uniref:Uncharacterized protein n=1 Tax=Culex quinquefasciatus TaxID=7176 RepID=B0XKP3_CULQU|nr:hypothetical protein CpipJ_CPIJ019944 [Culex quinquefasciatus]|eukprot:XP_001870215.1 hypothetical protein CpipJ_CPIJ019944 [Culex quinquefasciatus]